MLPGHLKKNIGKWHELHEMKRKLRHYALNTVCESARCPNIGECFSKGTATFMILGNRCTRSCAFCSVQKDISGLSAGLDEPARVASLAGDLGLGHVVITSVTRDDLPDGGAGVFADTIRQLRNSGREMKIEVLTPDFNGIRESLKKVVLAKPDIYSHNLETVPRLYPVIRKEADYTRSLYLLKWAKEIDPGLITKSAVMVGLGEKKEEMIELLGDLRKAGCDSVCIGQYLRPTRENVAVSEYVDPKMFEWYREKSAELGFRYVKSGPFVRSSYLASEIFDN